MDVNPVWMVYRAVWPGVADDAAVRAVRWAACEAAWRDQETRIVPGDGIEAKVAAAVTMVRAAVAVPTEDGE